MKYILFLSTLLFSLGLQAQISEGLKIRLEEIDKDPSVELSCASVLVKIYDDATGEAAVGAQLILQNKADAIYNIPVSGEVEILTDASSLSARIKPPLTRKNPYQKGSFKHLKIEAGKRYRLHIGLIRVNQIITPPPVARKPVLYFYPEKPMDIDIKLNPNGNFSFTYPKYKEGWKAKIFPNGNIIIDDKTYPYLFWEGQLSGIAPEVRQSGFVVSADESVDFLEEKLKVLGLNQREITDFITFWAPQLEQNPYNFIHFITGNAYETQIAELKLSEQPDSKIRIHLWYAALDTKIQVTEQQLSPQQRQGFSVVEWGGAKFNWIEP